ncbi:MAG: hypothetical protein HC925_01345 [Coleofasciculaceae cyanobacterium SM2_3_26]|nr:hypothetical protein [Coleofasciculaceae cyanobacterium SM2_3_26]
MKVGQKVAGLFGWWAIETCKNSDRERPDGKLAHHEFRVSPDCNVNEEYLAESDSSQKQKKTDSKNARKWKTPLPSAAPGNM